MNFNSKYKAFTLTETVFGLIISSVVIGVIYTMFTSFNKQFMMFQKQQLAANDFMLFDTTFRKDIYDAAMIDFNDVAIQLKQYDETIVQYSFEGEVIKRTYDAQTEVLFSTLISYTFQHKGNYDLITVKLQLYDETIVLNYHKRNTPNQTINTTFIQKKNAYKN